MEVVVVEMGECAVVEGVQWGGVETVVDGSVVVEEKMDEMAVVVAVEGVHVVVVVEMSEMVVVEV